MGSLRHPACCQPSWRSLLSTNTTTIAPLDTHSHLYNFQPSDILHTATPVTHSACSTSSLPLMSDDSHDNSLRLPALLLRHRPCNLLPCACCKLRCSLISFGAFLHHCGCCASLYIYFPPYDSITTLRLIGSPSRASYTRAKSHCIQL